MNYALLKVLKAADSVPYQNKVKLSYFEIKGAELLLLTGQVSEADLPALLCAGNAPRYDLGEDLPYGPAVYASSQDRSLDEYFNR